MASSRKSQPPKPPLPKAAAGSKKTAPRKRSTPAPEVAAALSAQESGSRDFAEYDLSDEAVERALLSGDHSGLLEDYFGADSYQELRQLSREASSRGVRGGPRVLILPGIMGSKIGRKRKSGLFDDTFWFNPVDVVKGRLGELALPDGDRFEAIGVLLVSYLKLKLRLKIAGYDVDFHPFDWRKSIAELGAQLERRLAAEGGEKVSLVAHSMGGLVARWALGHGAKCRRLIMLGTPNYGSFAPVMALRGVYPVVAKLGMLDREHRPQSAQWLAKNVFSTFPGLIQMFPASKVFSTLDLYDLASWPADGLSPRKEALAGIKDVHKTLLEEGENLYLIAGVNQDTVIGARRGDSGELEFESSKAGDGTVPLAFCQLPAIADRTYYVEETHGSLPNNGLVGKAVTELLDRGRTALLPQRPPTIRSASTWTGESRLVTDLLEVRGDAPLGRREMRTVLEEVASSTARDSAVIAMPVPGQALDPGDRGFQHRFEQVVVGRRLQHRLEIRLARGSITEADARAIVLGIFRDVSPRGPAEALDRRLGGAITEITRRRMFSGDVGEVFMLPTGRHPLSADLIAFVGLGAFDRFDAEVLQTAAENILRMFVQTRVEELATVVFGGSSGESPAAALRSLLTGFVQALCDADHDHGFRRVIVCERSPERYLAIKEELFRLASTSLCEGIEITFDEMELTPEMQVQEGTVARHLVPGPEPAYLIVRQEQKTGSGGTAKLLLRSSLLTSGGKATVVSGVNEVSESDLGTAIGTVTAENADFAIAGAALARQVLAAEVLELLERQREQHLVVVHDAAMSRVPWETLAVPVDAGDPAAPAGNAAGAGKIWFPSAENGISRRYAADNLSVAKWLEKRVTTGPLEVLLVVNPTEDLDGAEQEGQRVREVLASQSGIRLTELRRAEATRKALLDAFTSGRYDVIHYAGHAFFDPNNPERSGVLAAGRVPLSGADLAGLRNLPTLVFFNACESGRLRGRPVKPPKESPKTRGEGLAQAVGLAEAFLRGGVANLMGTYWPVGDESAKTFATLLYGELLRGSTIGVATQKGRQALQQSGSPDWANYILYGDPNFIVKSS